MDFLAIKRVIINLLKNYKERLEELNRAINETISTSNEECMEEVLDRKYSILRTILTI
jgi:16S rRNA G527 N7-methylase RsmG